ncbi:MAG TPA: histidinol dehydrogenase, partial [Bacillota bacterium]|nr:histidinol dehydrogenase [Bacillota bacterium]
EIYLCTPPDAQGKIHPLTLLAAKLAGATAVFKAGGAQAVAALAYGTETIPAVQKIVGPGNIYVTLAKREVYGTVGIDLLAGPSEIVVVADETAEPSFIAADLLSQAEHDPLAAPILVTCSRLLAEAVSREIEAQLARLPRREIAEKALRGQGAAILVPSLAEAWAIVNELAPEHLELHLADPWSHLDQIENAGAIFLGPHTPEPLGDYWAGSNHVLPTGRGACYASPLGVPDFLKRSHVVYYSASALRHAAPHVEALARAEGLEAHARAVAARRRDQFDPQRQD